MQNEVVKVNEKRIVAVEWNGERVITTAQLADVYETSADNVRVNFNNNKDRFTEGKHYYILKGEELRMFKRNVNDIYAVKPNINQIYLWTKRGASRHCITTGSTLANIGEAGREAVLPLENNLSYMKPLAEMIASEMKGVQTVRIVADEGKIFKIVKEEANDYYRRTGSPAFDF